MSNEPKGWEGPSVEERLQELENNMYKTNDRIYELQSSIDLLIHKNETLKDIISYLLDTLIDMTIDRNLQYLTFNKLESYNPSMQYVKEKITTW